MNARILVCGNVFDGISEAWASVARNEGIEPAIADLAYSGSLLVNTAEIYVFDAESGEQRFYRDAHCEEHIMAFGVYALGFSSDETWFASKDGDGKVLVWRGGRKRQRPGTPRLHPGPPISCPWSTPSGRTGSRAHSNPLFGGYFARRPQISFRISDTGLTGAKVGAGEARYTEEVRRSSG